MVTANDAAARARWQVVWINAKGKVVRRDFGDDFHEAMKVYTKAVQLGARATTLRCKNMSFPPPEQWRPTYVEKQVMRDGKKVTVREKHEPLEALNRQGKWWCPYCIKFRKFRHRDGYYTTEGVWMAEPAMVCPMCHIEHTAFFVKFWNPLARIITDSQLNTEGRSRAKRKRRAAIMEEG